MPVVWQIASQRMDGCCPSAYPEFAYAKAFTAVTTKGSSRAFRDKYTSTTDPAKFCQVRVLSFVDDQPQASSQSASPVG